MQTVFVLFGVLRTRDGHAHDIDPRHDRRRGVDVRSDHPAIHSWLGPDGLASEASQECCARSSLCCRSSSRDANRDEASSLARKERE